MEPLSARMDFEFDPLPEGFGAKVEELVNAELAAARPIVVSFIPRAEAVLDADLIRTKVNLVPESVPEIRVVDIVGLDKQADGGTHVRRTDEVGPHRGPEDRVQGQGQQADPPAGGGRLMPAASAVPELTALRRSRWPAGRDWWWRSAAGSTPDCWPGPPTTSSGPTGPWR